MKTNYIRSLIDGEIIYQPKRSKREDLKVVQKIYGDGVAWFRGAMIGKGSFGCVFKANLKNPNSRNTLYPSIMVVKSAEVSASGSIQIEKQVMDNIGSCSNFIKCFGDEITKGVNNQEVYNLLLEYATGGTLADLIKSSNGKGLHESDVKRYTRSILRGLRYIHKKGYAHCDLKPENIMLVDNCKNGSFIAKIGNLGSAKRAKKKKKHRLGPFWRGTPMYSSLKAAINSVQEQPTDIWAVCCIVFQMLTGKPLWSSNKDLSIHEILSRISVESVSPLFSICISREAMSFLKGCLCRNVTADMLLAHTFLEGLDEDDASQKEVLDINDITTSTSFSDDDADDDCNSNDELWLSSYSNGSSSLKGVLMPWKLNKAQMPDTEEY